MKLPQVKKILREDVKDAPDWIRGIIDPFNSFAENIYQALNKNITFTENTASFVKEVVYRTPSTYPSSVEPIEFQSLLKTKAIGVELFQVVERSTYTPPAGPVYVPWVEDNGVIRIFTITGLAADKSYLIRLLIS